VSRAEVDIGGIWMPGNLYDSIDDVILTINTVWAAFDLTLHPNTSLSSGISTIWYWDGTEWIWYRENPYVSSVNDFASWALLLSQTGSINTDGDKNSYTYTLKFATLIQELEDYVAADDYIGSVDFNIDFAY
jgi:hypothetical protein